MNQHLWNAWTQQNLCDPFQSMRQIHKRENIYTPTIHWPVVRRLAKKESKEKKIFALLP